MTRAERRHRLNRSKAAVVRKMRTWGWFDKHPEDITPDRIGKNETVHCRGCNCFVCLHHKDVPPKRERAFLDPYTG